MQGDGNLVMYRKDGSVRWSTGKNGLYSIMQRDGNFVEYSSFSALWHTGTYGNPGAALVIQDDGNLVIYAAYGRGPLWSIGADPGPNDPTRTGQVVGRDLDYGPGAPLGHIGIWDGREVIEAINQGGNAVRSVSIGDFKKATRYWGYASPAIPPGTVLVCSYTVCNNDTFFTVDVLEGIARRARQIKAIGADYTMLPTARRAVAAWVYGVPTRGLYRCDTFVLDVMFTPMLSDQAGDSAHRRWRGMLNDLDSPTLTPRRVFDTLAAYR